MAYGTRQFIAERETGGREVMKDEKQPKTDKTLKLCNKFRIQRQNSKSVQEKLFTFSVTQFEVMNESPKL